MTAKDETRHQIILDRVIQRIETRIKRLERVKEILVKLSETKKAPNVDNDI